jgi:hypothetical protein
MHSILERFDKGDYLHITKHDYKFSYCIIHYRKIQRRPVLRNININSRTYALNFDVRKYSSRESP